MTNGKKVRSPVIAVRVRAPLHKRIVKAAKVSGRSMSEELAVLIERGFEFTDRYGNRSMAIWAQPMKLAVSKLEINSGDTAVLHVDHLLNVLQLKQFREAVESFMPDGVKVMVISHGASLSVMKKAAA